MLQTLYDYIHNIHPVSDEVTNALGECFEIIELPRRHLLLKDGETCHYLYLVVDGLARMYYLKDGQ